MPRDDLQSTSINERRVAASVARAAALHQTGKLDEAEAIYKGLLEENPRHAAVLTLLGLVRLQRRDAGGAIAHLEASLEIEPKQAPALINLGKALAALGRHREAMASFDRAIALKPDSAAAYCHRGNARAASGLAQDALADFDKAIALKPDHALAFNDRGNALQALGRYEDALASFDKALALKPDLAVAHYNRGNLLEKLGRGDDAVASYRRAVAHDPAFAAAHNNLGNALKAQGLKEEALACYDKTIALRPEHAQAHNNRGGVLQELGRNDEALESLQRAIALKPDYAQAYYNRGNLFSAWNRHEDALSSFDEAIGLAPGHVEAWSNRGLLLQALGRHEEALASFDRAIAIAPDDAVGYWNKSLLKLLQGDFAEGWRLYEWRRRNPMLNRPRLDFDEPLWLGDESLEGKTILLHPEQGFGDTIQFCRYAAMVAARGATVILEVQRPLKSLMETLDGPSQVVALNTSLLRYDYQTPLLSLPLAFNTGLADIPVKVPYLRASPHSTTHWSETLGARKRTRIGLAWSGRPTHGNDRNRSIALAELSPLFGCDVEFVGLQKEGRPGDDDTLASIPNLTNLGPELADFADTAALIMNLDLVISVDTSVAHLAGALGKPVWILLPFAPDWRWLLDREDSPWYPTARLFRQASIGDWSGVVARIERALREFAAQRPDPGDRAVQA